MSYTMTTECINCDRCRSQCPTNAIQIVNGILKINPNLCNDCVGYYGIALCIAGCPTNYGCVSSSNLTAQTTTIAPTQESQGDDYWDSWFITYNSLIGKFRTKESKADYWESWFTTYNSLIEKLRTQESKADYWESWFNTYNSLVETLRTKKQAKYWERWFDLYASKLKPLLDTSSIGMETKANAFS